MPFAPKPTNPDIGIVMQLMRRTTLTSPLVTDIEIAAAINRRVEDIDLPKNGWRHVAQAAADRLRKEEEIWLKRIRNQKCYKLLTDEEKVSELASSTRGMRRKALRTAKLARLVNRQNLKPETKIAYDLHASLHGVLAMLSKPSTQKQISAAVQTSGTKLAVGSILQIVK